MGKKKRSSCIRQQNNHTGRNSHCKEDDDTGTTNTKAFWRADAYERYKETTRAFSDGLSKIVPFRLYSVSDLSRAAEHLFWQSSSFFRDDDGDGCNLQQDTISQEINGIARNKSKKKTEGCVIDHALLRNLDETIRLRKAVGATYVSEHNTYDDGHGFMIQTLEYCRKVLHKTRWLSSMSRRKSSSSSLATSTTATTKTGSSSTTTTTHVSSRFDLLSMDDNDEESDNDISDIDDDHDLDGGNCSNSSRKCSPVITDRSKAPKDEKEYSIEDDLIEGSLQFQANLFFLTMEQLFTIVTDAYDHFANELERLQSSNEHSSSQDIHHKTITLLLQTTAKVNLVIEQVHTLESSFCLGEPFHSTYDLLAVLVFSNEIYEIQEILRRSTKKVLEARPHIAVQLARHSIQVGFAGANAYLSPRGLKDILKQLLASKKIFKNASVSRDTLEEVYLVCLRIAASADFERLLTPDLREKRKSMMKNGSVKDSKSIQVIFQTVDKHSSRESETIVDIQEREWLTNYGKLGGRTSGIVYTFAQMEKVKTHPSLMEHFANKYSQTSDDIDLETMRSAVDSIYVLRLYQQLLLMQFDDLFMKYPIDLVPGFDCSNKNMSLCLPFLRHLQKDLPKNRNNNGMVECGETRFVTAFGVHSMSYGMVRLQSSSKNGDICKRLAVLSRLCVQRFQDQFHEMKNTPYLLSMKGIVCDGSQIDPLLLHFVSMYMNQCHGLLQSSWNPLSAGSYLLTFAFDTNLCRGFRYADACFQTRTVLQLYNALRCRTLVASIDALDLLDRALKKSTAVWPDGKQPQTKDDILWAFCKCWGDSKRVVDAFVAFFRVDRTDEKLYKAAFTANRRYTRGLMKDLPVAQQDLVERAVNLTLLREKHGFKPTFVSTYTPYQFSPAYKCFLCQDFSKERQEEDVAGASSLQNSKSNNCSVGLSAAVCARQARILGDAIGEEHELLSINWLKVGVLLDTFVEQMLQMLGISNLIVEFRKLKVHGSFEFQNSTHEKLYDRYLANLFLADMVFCELEREEVVHHCSRSKEVAKLMMDYFTSTARKESLCFF